MLYFLLQMENKVEVPLNAIEKDMGQLESNLQRSAIIMNSMQKTADKFIRFPGQKPIEKQRSESESSLVKKLEIQTDGVDDGCMFSGTASGKSANVKVILVWC